MADNRIAYGLAKKYGIDTTGMSPKEVWEALRKKGVTEKNIADGAYNSQEGRATVLARQLMEKRKREEEEAAEKRAKNKFAEELPRKTKEAIKSIENKTNSLTYETGAIISKEGRILQQIRGTENAVNVSDEKLLKDAVFTHNHPQGSCFSNQDIESFLITGLYQLRATTPSGKTYVLTKTKDYVKPSLAYDYKKAVSDFRGEGAKRIQELVDEYSKCGYSLNNAIYRAQSDYREEWLTRHAEEYNVKFEVEWDE